MFQTEFVVFPNKVGTAPGLLFQKNEKYFVALHSVPFEMVHLIKEQVLPFLVKLMDEVVVVHNGYDYWATRINISRNAN